MLVRSRLLALGRQSERLVDHDDLALNLPNGTNAHAIMGEGIPDQALTPRTGVCHRLQDSVPHLLEGRSCRGEVHAVYEVIE